MYIKGQTAEVNNINTMMNKAEHKTLCVAYADNFSRNIHDKEVVRKLTLHTTKECDEACSKTYHYTKITHGSINFSKLDVCRM